MFCYQIKNPSGKFLRSMPLFFADVGKMWVRLSDAKRALKKIAYYEKFYSDSPYKYHREWSADCVGAKIVKFELVEVGDA